MSALTHALPRPDRLLSRLLYEVSLVLGGSLLIAGLAQVAVPLPFTPVPISGQTLGVLLIGAGYGWARGGITLAVYILQIAVGLPFAAEGKSGVEILTFATASGGYIWGFALAALLVGWLAQRGWDRELSSSIGMMLLGTVVIYLLGIPWLMRSVGLGLEDALMAGLAPFVIGDLLKLLVAAAALPAAWHLLGRSPD